ncbi:MAG: cag pathogenicity island protein Cag26 [Calditrichaeota bacterium]|nr:MAG: cag pathogenicity island protein Cag26 [Calditrichota bacterium]
MKNKIFKRATSFFNFLKRENILRILAVLTILIIFSAVGMAFFEKNTIFKGLPFVDALKNALWWSVVTMTTVGYGDLAPITVGGRMVGTVIMILGIGILGIFTATIASVFVEKKLKEERGMGSYNFENHVILCEWTNRTRELLAELRNDNRCTETPMILISPIENKPVDDENLYFIQGDVNEENLKRANIFKARTVVIMSDDSINESARDAKAVLTTLTVECMNEAAYTIVELVDESNVQHCRRAKADEIIVGAEFSTKLISRAALEHGISKVISELLSSQFGNDLYKVPLPNSMAGKEFIDVFTEMKRIHKSIVLGVQRDGDAEVISNPDVDFIVNKDDSLILIAANRPV